MGKHHSCNRCHIHRHLRRFYQNVLLTHKQTYAHRLVFIYIEELVYGSEVIKIPIR